MTQTRRSNIKLEIPELFNSREGIYNSTSSANSSLVEGRDRSRGMFVKITEGGELKLYWYQQGTADSDLVKYSPDLPSNVAYSDTDNDFPFTTFSDAISVSENIVVGGNLSDGSNLFQLPLSSGRLAITDNIPTDNSQLANGSGYITGNQSISIIGDVLGSGTTSINVTIQNDSVEAIMLNDNVISGQTDLPSGLVSDDELLVSDNGILKKMDISVLQTYMQDNLTFGGSGTITLSGAITGSGTGSISTTLSDNTVTASKLTDNAISGQPALTGTLASTDEFIISDNGTLRRMDTSVLQTYMQNNLNFSNGDITAVNPGTNITGGGTSGAVTVNLSTTLTGMSAATFSGTVTASDLTVSGNIFHSGDTDTYIGFEDNQVLIRTGGSERVSVTNSGVSITGEITATGDITAFSTSDSRLKNNVSKIENSLNILSNINGYRFSWDKKSGKSGSDIGVMAQEVREVMPDIVTERDNGYLAVRYEKIIPLLIEGVNELNDSLIKAMEVIDNLESRVKKIELNLE